MRKAFWLLAALWMLLPFAGAAAEETLLPLEACNSMAGIGSSLYVSYGAGGWNMARCDIGGTVEQLGQGAGSFIGGQYDGAMTLSGSTVAAVGAEGQGLTIPSGLLGSWTDACVRVKDTLFLQTSDEQGQGWLVRVSMQDGKGSRVEGCIPKCIAAGRDALYVMQQAQRGGDALYEIAAYDAQGREMGTLAGIDTAAAYGLAWDADTGDLYWMESTTLRRLRDGQTADVRALPADWLSTKAAAFLAGQYALLGNDGRVRLYDVAEDAQQTLLTIRGVAQQGLPVDGAFMLANPDIGIQRTTESHLCAEEIYTDILSGESGTDIYLVEYSKGVSDLMAKGYLAALEDDAALLADAQGMYPVFQQAVMAGGRLYAVAESVQVRGWAVSADMAERVDAPDSLAELLDQLEVWEDSDLNDGRAFLRDSVYGDWTAVDLACYALEQSILRQTAAGEAVTFTDEALMATLACIRALADSGALPMSRGNAGSSVLSAPCPGTRVTNGVNVLGSSWEREHIIAVPGLTEGEDGLVWATVMVYVVNPRSPHQAEARAFLAYMAANRHAQQQGCLQAEVTPVLYDSMAEELAALEAEAAQAEQALADAPAAERATRQDYLEKLRARQQALAERPDNWMYYAPAIAAYREAVVPRLFIGPCRLLELAHQTHASVWDELTKAVQQYLEGFTGLEQCVQRLGQIARTLALEE